MLIELFNFMKFLKLIEEPIALNPNIETPPPTLAKLFLPPRTDKLDPTLRKLAAES
jgi:hypothetical protein